MHNAALHQPFVSFAQLLLHIFHKTLSKPEAYELTEKEENTLPTT